MAGPRGRRLCWELLTHSGGWRWEEPPESAGAARLAAALGVAVARSDVGALAVAREPAHALGGPQQHLHRITPTVFGHEPLKRHHQLGVTLGDRLAPTTTSPHPTTLKALPRSDLQHPLPDRVLRDPTRPRHRRDPTTTKHSRLRRRPYPPTALTQLRRQRPKPLTDQLLIDHAPQFYATPARSFTLFNYGSLVSNSPTRTRTPIRPRGRSR